MRIVYPEIFFGASPFVKNSHVIEIIAAITILFKGVNFFLAINYYKILLWNIDNHSFFPYFYSNIEIVGVNFANMLLGSSTTVLSFSFCET